MSSRIEPTTHDSNTRATMTTFAELYPNPQLAFDRVWKHFVTEARSQCKDFNGGCRYRNNKGLCCAAGCLVPTEDYNPEWEKLNVTDIPVDDPFWSSMGERAERIVSAMQHAHDVWMSGVDYESFREHMRTRLLDIAAAFGLSAPEA